VYFLLCPSKVKVHDLEQKCRTQSEQCNILSKKLEKYHLGSDTEDTLHIDSQEKNLSNSYNSLQHQAKKSEQSIFLNSFPPSHEPFTKSWEAVSIPTGLPEMSLI